MATYTGATDTTVHSPHRFDSDRLHNHDNLDSDPRRKRTQPRTKGPAKSYSTSPPIGIREMPTVTNQTDSNLREEVEILRMGRQSHPRGRSLGHSQTPSTQLSSGSGIVEERIDWDKGMAFSPPPPECGFVPSLSTHQSVGQCLNPLSSMQTNALHQTINRSDRMIRSQITDRASNTGKAGTEMIGSRTINEVMASLLVSLPFALMSLLSPRRDGETNREGPCGQDTLSLNEILLVTGLILVSTGFCIKFMSHSQSRDRVPLPNRSNVSIIRRSGLAHAVAGIFAVGLPFYSVVKLGNVRVCTFLLSAVIMGLSGRSPSVSGILNNTSAYGRLNHNRVTVASLLLQLGSDILGWTSDRSLQALMAGYSSLVLSIWLFPIPFALLPERAPVEMVPQSGSAFILDLPKSVPLNTDMLTVETAVAGGALSLLAAAASHMIWSGMLVMGSLARLSYLASITLSAIVAINFSLPYAVASKKKAGFAIALAVLIGFNLYSDSIKVQNVIIEGGLVIVCWAALYLDGMKGSHPKQPGWHERNNTSASHGHTHRQASAISRYLISQTLDWPIIHSILTEDDSRPVFYFMLLNLTFMGIQAFYSVVTESLGLLSDSIHMFFDCFALAVGLAAAVMSKWPPSARFPYGYGMLNVLAGFGNGVFLMLISIEIVYEAFERLVEGVEMNRLKELFIVSLLGMIVNLIGLLAMPHHHHHHGHDHSHNHGHSHSHSHSHNHNHDHAHGHNHSHGHVHERKSSHENPEQNSHSHSHGYLQEHSHKHSDFTQHDHNDDIDATQGGKLVHASHDLHLHDGEENVRKSEQTLYGQNFSSSFRDPTVPGPLNAVDLNTVPVLQSNRPNLPVHGHDPSLADTHTQPGRQSHTNQTTAYGHGLHHGHSHSHSHDHLNENMLGIWLHIAADALGSLSVVISTILIHFTTKSYWDPIASILIAALIFASAIPLVKSCATRLLLTNPSEVEFDLKETLQTLSSLRGVEGVCVPKFWAVEGEENERKTHGVLHVIAGPREPLDDIQARVEAEFKERSMIVLVQVERDNEGRCWCGGGRFKN